MYTCMYMYATFSMFEMVASLMSLLNVICSASGAWLIMGGYLDMQCEWGIAHYGWVP